MAAYSIVELEPGLFEAENEDTGAKGRGESPEEALEALLEGEQAAPEDLLSAEAFDNGYSQGYEDGREYAIAEMRSTLANMASERE